MSLNSNHLGLRLSHPRAFFSLVPVNDKAETVVNSVNNSHLVSLSSKSKTPSFDIGFHINSQSPTNTLVTLGRDESDIQFTTSSIARNHCSFEVDDLQSGIIMLYDRSHHHNTRIWGTKSKPFESGRSPRRILVHPAPKFNNIISMGGVRGDLFVFKIEWSLTAEQIQRITRMHQSETKDTVTNPRKARTRDESETVLESVMLTPEEAFQESSETGLRYFKTPGDMCGAGSFGSVWPVIDVDSGRLMAMKRINRVSGRQEREHVRKVRMEVELMRQAKHVSIRSHETLSDVAYCKAATYRRVDHFAGLGGRFFLGEDIYGSRRGNLREIEH